MMLGTSFGNEDDGDMEEADLMPWDKTTVVALTDYFREIKRLEGTSRRVESSNS